MRLQRVAAVGLLLLVSGCSRGGDESSTPETLPVSTEAATSTTTSTSTTSSTQAESTPTTLSAEDEVLAVHLRFMTEFFARDERDFTAEELSARAAEVAVEPLLTRIVERTTERAQEGSYEISPGYESKVVEVEVDSDTATVLDCSLDLGVLYDAAGDVLIDADQEHRLRRTVLTLTETGWFVSEFFTGGDPCTPGA